MRICPVCQRDNEPLSLFCSHCGSKLPPPPLKNNSTGENDLDRLAQSVRGMGIAGRSYSWLSFYSTLIIVIGAFLTISSVISFIFSCALITGAPAFPTSDGGSIGTGLAALMSIFSGLGGVLASLLLFFTGIGLLAHGEMLKLMIDLQANNDTQVLLLQAIFHALYLKKKAE